MPHWQARVPRKSDQSLQGCQRLPTGSGPQPSAAAGRPGWTLESIDADRKTVEAAARSKLTVRFQRDTGVQGLVSVGRNGEFDHLLMEDVYWRTVRRIRRLAEEL